MVGDMSRAIAIYVLDFRVGLLKEILAVLPLFVCSITLTILADVHRKQVVEPVVVLICLHGPAKLQKEESSRDF
jgi:hypothetical protein